MNIQELVLRFQSNPNWIVHPPRGLPQLSSDPRAPNARIPDEVLRFYELCGGLKSVPRPESDVAFEIVSPDSFRWAIAAIVGRYSEQEYIAFRNNRAWYWYILGYSLTDEYFMIDLAPERYGRCYYVYFYFFGQPGGAPIVGLSFEDLLERFYKAVEEDDPMYWEHEKLGDAYD